MALIDKETIRKEIERLISISKVENGFPIGYIWKNEAYKELLAFLDTLPEQCEEGPEEYCPYKTTVESILKMFDSYSITTDKSDFIDNIRVKCKDAVEYDKLFPKHHRETEQSVSEDLDAELKRMVYDAVYDLDGPAIIGTSKYLSVEDIADIARHFAEWGAEHLKK